MDMTKKEARPENYKWVYNLGVVGLAAMAMVWFWLAIQISCMSPEAWGFSGIYSIVIAFLGGPFWLAIGVFVFGICKESAGGLQSGCDDDRGFEYFRNCFHGWFSDIL